MSFNKEETELLHEIISAMNSRGYSTKEVMSIINKKHSIELRDKFACAAMQGFASSPTLEYNNLSEMARIAYDWAEAMIRGRDLRTGGS